MDRDVERAIEWDCNRLVIKFYTLLDDKRYDELADLFTDDGEMNTGEREPIRGREALLDTLGAFAATIPEMITVGRLLVGALPRR